MALSIQMLDDAEEDLGHIDDVANSPELTATDRHGRSKDTVAGAVYKIAGITNRGAWAAATAYVPKDIVLQGGFWYVCVVAHTSSAAFATDEATKWRLYQGVTTGDLSAGSGAQMVGIQLSATGAAARLLSEFLDELPLHITNFTGANDTAKLAAAFAAAPDGGVIVLPPGSYSIASVNFTGKSVTIFGYGAEVTCTSATGAIYKSDHGNKLRVMGVHFTGSGRAINHQSAAETSVYDELEVMHCRFEMTGVYGIYCVGTREPRINFCTFEGTNGDGVYFKDCVSPFLFQCLFEGHGYTRRAVYYPGTGNGTDAGLVLRDCEIMGWDKGVEVKGCDFLIIDGCTIDYNNQSIKVITQDRATITNNYIGSLGATAALWITSDGSAYSPAQSEKIQVLGNTFTGHYEGGSTYDCILIDGSPAPDKIHIKDNNITFYTRYGINFSLDSTTRMQIMGNHFAQRSGFGVSPIYNSAGNNDTNVTIKDNNFSNGATIAGMNLSSLCRVVKDNQGMTLSTQGLTQIAVGNSTVSFAHGITGYTPSRQDIAIWPVNPSAIAAQGYVSAVDATNVTITTINPVATADASWGYRGGRNRN